MSIFYINENGYLQSMNGLTNLCLLYDYTEIEFNDERYIWEYAL